LFGHEQSLTVDVVFVVETEVVFVVEADVAGFDDLEVVLDVEVVQVVSLFTTTAVVHGTG